LAAGAWFIGTAITLLLEASKNREEIPQCGLGEPRDVDVDRSLCVASQGGAQAAVLLTAYWSGLRGRVRVVTTHARTKLVWRTSVASAMPGAHWL
jgi:hypothetical protein